VRRLTVRLTVPTLRTAREVGLTVGGLGLLTAGAWNGLGLWAGLVASGLSFLTLEFLTRPEPGMR